MNGSTESSNAIADTLPQVLVCWLLTIVIQGRTCRDKINVRSDIPKANLSHCKPCDFHSWGKSGGVDNGGIRDLPRSFAEQVELQSVGTGKSTI